MKSHDFHIWIERILPTMTRGYLPEPVWCVLAELSYYANVKNDRVNKEQVREMVCQEETDLTEE
jgi:hypothetical protein